MKDSFEFRLRVLEACINDIYEMLGAYTIKEQPVTKRTPADFPNPTPSDTKVVFRHLRNYDVDGNPSNIGGMTVCFILDFFNSKIKIGWSICANENFSKVVGSNYAQIRAEKSPVVIDYPAEGISESGLLGLIYVGPYELRDVFEYSDGNPKVLMRFMKQFRKSHQPHKIEVGDIVTPVTYAGLQLADVPVVGDCDTISKDKRPVVGVLIGTGKVVDVFDTVLRYDDDEGNLVELPFRNLLIESDNILGWAGEGAVRLVEGM